MALFLGILLGPSAALAQDPPKLNRIGFLVTSRNAPASVREALRQNGFAEGQQLLIEHRTADSPERFAAYATELVRLNVRVIFTEGPAALKAAAGVTSDIPIVAIDMETDPVEEGLVTTLARPGRNVTGVFLDAPELVGKWFELLKEAVPDLSRVVALWDPSTGRAQVNAAGATARALKIQFHSVEVNGAKDLDRALSAAIGLRPDALLLLSSPVISVNSSRIAQFALKRRLPAISMFALFVRSGGLVAYGPQFDALFARCGEYVARILKGAAPGALPIQRPTTFRLILNRTTAGTLGLTLSPALLLRADQVVQ